MEHRGKLELQWPQNCGGDLILQREHIRELAVVGSDHPQPVPRFAYATLEMFATCSFRAIVGRSSDLPLKERDAVRAMTCNPGVLASMSGHGDGQRRRALEQHEFNRCEVAGCHDSTFALVLCAISFAAFSQDSTSLPGHYLFAWAGDVDKKGNDFLAVIDADPNSQSYGQLITTVATDQASMQVHHTEYTMPLGGRVFANDHLAGRTFIFDLRDALHPRIVTSFTDLAGYSHPHSFLRLPNGHVLASFQHVHAVGMDMAVGSLGSSGGLVEIDDQGNVLRSASTADPMWPDALLIPYSLVVLPDQDRVLVTNSSMHDTDPDGHSYQLFRLSDLKLLKTEYFDTGGRHYGEINPEEPLRAADGSVFVQTLACGLERVTGTQGTAPKSKLVYLFPGVFCGVPTIVGHYLIQSVPVYHGVVVLDIAKPDKPREVSRLKIDDVISPHWTSWDPIAERLVVTGYKENRLFLLTLDQAVGAIKVDATFHDANGKPGFDFDERHWPHGWTGSANPHGVVFSR